jgi:predicted lipid-binding transport protein (Tim44 family)
MANSQLLDIVLIAMVAGVILFRLYTVLGRRTGHEREPSERFNRVGGAKPGDNVVALPDRSAARAEPAKPLDPVAKGLLDIKLADRGFDTDHFLAGARQAYEIIVVAFASADREALRPLLSGDVFSTFDAAIRAREERKEKVSFTLVGIKDVKVVLAALKDRMADITVQFSSQFISATTNFAGAVIDGDPKAVREVTDSWTFARDTGARDPNWTLVATGEPEAH